jgi:flagellar biosynthesis chaperone FliJ
MTQIIDLLREQIALAQENLSHRWDDLEEAYKEVDQCHVQYIKACGRLADLTALMEKYIDETERHSNQSD